MLNVPFHYPFLMKSEYYFPENEGHNHKVDTNLTTDDDDDNNSNLLSNLMRPQKFTPGTLLGLLVASLVVVIGSFLVLWKVCCEVEMRVSREGMEPLKSISQGVGAQGRSVSGESLLLGHSCSSSVMEIA